MPLDKDFADAIARLTALRDEAQAKADALTARLAKLQAIAPKLRVLPQADQDFLSEIFNMR